MAFNGCEVTVRSGRIGAAGQAMTTLLADQDAARRHAEGLVADKACRGYSWA